MDSPQQRLANNTHNLGWTEDAYGAARGDGGGGPGAVGVAFDAVGAHLASDDAGVGAQPTDGEQAVQQLADGATQCDAEVDGAGQAGADAAPGGVQRGGEADPVGVKVVVVGGGMDERAQRVVHAQVAPGFLVHSGGRAGAQEHPRPALVGLELVED